MIFLLSECDRTRSPSMLNSTYSFHKFFMCVLFETVQNPHWVLVSWRICEQNIKNSISEFLVVAAQTVPHPMIRLNYSPMIYHDLHLSIRGWHMSLGWQGSGARSSKFFGRTVFHFLINTPPLAPQFIYSARRLSLPLELSNLVPPLISIVAGEEELSCLDLIAVVLALAAEIFTFAAIVVVFLRQVRVWKIWTDVLPQLISQFI